MKALRGSEYTTVQSLRIQEMPRADVAPIDYNGHLQVHSSLLGALLRD
jgi:hypothetical protein